MLQPGGSLACGSCGTYATRPAECKQYKCGWLDGDGGDNERPDLCGVISEIARRGDGSPIMAVLMPAPGFSENCSEFQRHVKRWRMMKVTVATPTQLISSADELMELRGCAMRFVDGTTVPLEIPEIT